MVCFVLTDLMINLPGRAAFIVERTLMPTVRRAHKELISNDLDSKAQIITYLTVAVDCYPVDNLQV